MSSFSQSELELRAIDPLQGVIAALPAAAMAVRAKRCVAINRFAAELLGIDDAQTEFFDDWQTSFAPACRSRLRATLRRTGLPEAVNTRATLKNGSVIDFRVSAYEGLPETFLIVMQQSSVQPIELRSIYEAEDSLEATADLAHEMRSYGTMLLGSAQLLHELFKSRSLEIEGIDVAGHIHRLYNQALRLLRQTNNMLDAARLSTGAYKAHFTNVDIRAMIHELGRSVDAYMASKQLSLTLPSRCGKVLVACDALMLERSLLNLLSNAIKYTPPGGSIFIELQVQRKSVMISVRDTGCGIPAEMIERIFMRYEQVDDTYSLRHGSSGIGLSLVQAMMRLQDGCVRVRSLPGEGSTFTLVMPRRTLSDSDVSYERPQVSSIEATTLEMSGFFL